MWKALWQKWTIDKPALLGDWLWEIFVVQLAAYLDRLTLRRIVAVIPVVFVILAYYHSIPIPPEAMLVGDLLAYIDIFSVLLLLGILSRAATILFIVKRATAQAGKLALGLMAMAQRFDVRHRRARRSKGPKRLTGRPTNDDDEPIAVGGFAWA